MCGPVTAVSFWPRTCCPAYREKPDTQLHFSLTFHSNSLTFSLSVFKALIVGNAFVFTVSTSCPRKRPNLVSVSSTPDVLKLMATTVSLLAKTVDTFQTRLTPVTLALNGKQRSNTSGAFSSYNGAEADPLLSSN